MAVEIPFGGDAHLQLYRYFQEQRQEWLTKMDNETLRRASWVALFFYADNTVGTIFGDSRSEVENAMAGFNGPVVVQPLKDRKPLAVGSGFVRIL